MRVGVSRQPLLRCMNLSGKGTLQLICTAQVWLSSPSKFALASGMKANRSQGALTLLLRVSRFIWKD